MYILYRGAKETLLSLPRSGEGATVSFTRSEIESLIPTLIFRKERNNGVARHLISQLRFRYHYHPRPTGACEWFAEGGFSHTLPGTRSGFSVRPSFAFKDRYELQLFGDVDRLLARANGVHQSLQARVVSRKMKEERRGKPKRPKVVQPRALPGANASLHWHFRNHTLTFDDAARIIAKAGKRAHQPTREHLLASLDGRGVASFRLQGGFVFRVDVMMWGTIPNPIAPVELRTTSNNEHSAWRRLRRLLKAHFDCEPRTRKRAEAAYRARKKEERVFRLCA